MSDQSESSAVYNILAFAFQGKDTAKQIVKEVKSSGALDGYDIVAQAIVDQNEKGKVHIHEPGHGVWGATLGAVGGGLLGLIGGPVGVLALAAGGAVVGGAAGHLDRVIPKEDLEEIGEALQPDSSAFLLLLEDTYSEGVVDSMSGYNANVVTLTVGSELSGQIATYTEGSVSDAAGDVVAAAGGAAADASGNVVAGQEVAATDAEGNVVAGVEAAAADAEGNVVAGEAAGAAAGDDGGDGDSS
jgi:uncharacterized membrane protein